MGRLAKATTATGGVLVALLTGLIGLVGIFSDLSASESVFERVGFLTATYAVGCGIVGAMIPHAWYVGLLAAWGPGLFGLFGLAMRLSRGGPYPYWSFLAAELLLIPAAALLFGYAGSWTRGRLSKSPAGAA